MNEDAINKKCHGRKRPGASTMTTKIALQISISSPQCAADLKRGLIINGETGGVEQIGDKSDAIEKRSYTDDLLKRAEQVIDTVTIVHRQTHLLPSPDLPKVA